jgi:hypothetical protein
VNVGFIPFTVPVGDTPETNTGVREEDATVIVGAVVPEPAFTVAPINAKQPI